MAAIKIPGITPDLVENTSTEGSSGWGRPFPCDASGYTPHTGQVVSAGIKTFTVDGKAKDNLSIIVSNDGHTAELLLALDPTDVGSWVTDREKAIQENLEALTRAIKLLGAFTPKGELDTAKLEKAKGKLVSFIAKHKGFRDANKNKFKHNGENARPGGPRYTGGTLYHDITLIFKGEAKELTGVPMIPFPEFPLSDVARSQGQAQPGQPGQPGGYPDDIPF